MLRRKQNERVPLRQLLRTWERARTDGHVDAAAARTATALARVHDVPSQILESLDTLLSGTWEGQATAIYDVVAYLRQLEQLDRIAGNKNQR